MKYVKTINATDGPWVNQGTVVEYKDRTWKYFLIFHPTDPPDYSVWREQHVWKEGIDTVVLRPVEDNRFKRRMLSDYFNLLLDSSMK